MTDDRKSKAQLVKELKSLRRKLRRLEQTPEGGRGGKPVPRQDDYFEALVRNSPVAMVAVDLNADVVAWNPAAEELFGYTFDEAVGRNLDGLVARSEAIRAEALGYSGDALGGGRIEGTTRRTRKDGAMVDVEVLGLPVILQGEQRGFIAIYHDISAAKQAEAELRNQKSYLEVVVQHSPVAIVIIDPDASVRAWNPGAEKLFGYTPDEAVGQNIDDLVAKSPEIRAEAVGFSRKGGRGAVIHAITRRTRKDGSLVDVELSAVPVDFGGKQRGYIALYHDVSAHKQAEAELSTQKSYLEAVVQHSPVAIVVIDRDTIVRAWNPGAEKLFGYTPEEAIAQNIDDLVAKVPEVRAEAVGFSRRGARRAVIQAITRRSRKDG